MQDIPLAIDHLPAVVIADDFMARDPVTPSSVVRAAARSCEKPILIVWWGARSRQGTVGDCLAVCNVVFALQQRGAEVEIAADRGFQFTGARSVNWWTVNPFRYRCVVFVCGPLTNSWYFRLLFSKFAWVRKVAVGVSVLEPRQRFTRSFDTIVARDGLPESHFDLAVAGELIPHHAERPYVLVCLRGHQSEYGAAVCHSARVDELIWHTTQRLGLPVKAVNMTVTPHTDALGHVHRSFSQARLVLTTRLHGALFALRHGVPFIAVDQIEGGRKLTSVVRKLGWEYLYPADVQQAGLDAACHRVLLDENISRRVHLAAVHAQKLSRLALQRAVEVILSQESSATAL